MQAALGRLRLDFAEKIQFERHDFPLRPLTFRAAEGVRCAADQGKGEEMSHMVFAGQDAWATRPADPIWTSYARGLGLDLEKWGSCIRSETHRAAIEADRDLGLRMGVDATPTFFIGAQRLDGAAPYEKLAEMVRAELQRAPASR